MTDTMADGHHDNASVTTLLENPDSVTASQVLHTALDRLDSAETALPVLDDDRTHLVGWLTHQRVLAAMRTPSAPL